MNVAWTLLWYVIAVGFLVIVHEYGHFWVARRLGFKVLRFSIGFGKPIWRRVIGKDQTELVLGPIPMGGYVKMLDEREGPVPPELLARSFTRKPPWQRILVLLAGPGFNVLFAILLLWAMRWVSGVDYPKYIIGEVQPASVAARGGLAKGDEILGVGAKIVPDSHDVLFDLLNAILIDNLADLARVISGAAGTTVTLQYLRGGAPHTAQVPVRAKADATGHVVGRIGIAGLPPPKLPPDMLVHKDLSAGAALYSAVDDAWD